MRSMLRAMRRRPPHCDQSTIGTRQQHRCEPTTQQGNQSGGPHLVRLITIEVTALREPPMNAASMTTSWSQNFSCVVIVCAALFCLLDKCDPSQRPFTGAHVRWQVPHRLHRSKLEPHSGQAVAQRRPNIFSRKSRCRADINISIDRRNFVSAESSEYEDCAFR